MPPLFMSVRPLYTNADKVALIEKLVVGYLTNIDASGSFTAGGEKESPTVVIWVLHFLAQHYDRLGQVGDARAGDERAAVCGRSQG